MQARRKVMQEPGGRLESMKRVWDPFQGARGCKWRNIAFSRLGSYMKGAGWEGGSYPTLSPSFMWVLPEPSNDPAPRNAGDQGSPGGHNCSGQPREHRVGSKRREGITLRSTEGWTKAPPATQAAHTGGLTFGKMIQAWLPGRKGWGRRS